MRYESADAVPPTFSIKFPDPSVVSATGFLNATIEAPLTGDAV